MPAASSIRPSPSSAWIPIRPSTFPATTARRFLAACARRTTSPDALPTSEVRSKEPSPVTTKSALARAASKPTRSSTHWAPGTRPALAKNARPAPRPPAAPPRIQKRPTEPASRAGSAVHGGRAAQADHHQRGTALGCLPDEFAHASRRRAQRIQLVGAEQRDAARSGALEDRGLSIHPAELAAYRVAEWTGDRDLLAEGPRCEHDVQQAIAPVRDRALEQRGPRKGPADPGGQRFRHLARAERAFECCWSHEDYRLHSALCIDSCILLEHQMSR